MPSSKHDWQKSLRGASDLTDAEFRVLTTLGTYADANLMNARPGLTRLATDACLTERWTRKALGGLVEKGYIVLTKQGGNQVGKGQANVYRLVPMLSPRGSLSDPLGETEGGHCATPKGVTARHGRGSLGDPPSVLSSHQEQARTREGSTRGDCAVCSRPYAACRRADCGAGQYSHEFKPRRKVDALGFVIK